MNNHVRKRTHNTANNDAPSSEMYYSCRSIVFGARQLIIYSAKSNGVVSRNVSRHGNHRLGGSMKSFIAFAVCSSILLAGCATTTTQIAKVSPERVKEEQLQQRIIVIQELAKQQDRLDSLVFPLLVAAADLNPKKSGQIFGIRFDHVLRYEKEWQPAARQAGISDTLMIVGVIPGSPAQRAGIRVGDRLMAVNSTKIPVSNDAAEVARKVLSSTPNGTATIQLLREGSKFEVTVRSTTIAKLGHMVTIEGGINAYADGENIIIPWAMMRFAKDEELQVVIAHEIAHNLMGHIEARKQNALIAGLFGALGDVAMASAGYRTGGYYTQQFAALGAQAFSQDFEREADYVGMYILARSGFPLENAPNLWRYFAQIDPKAIAYASTHPTTAERFVLLEQTAKEIRNKQSQSLPLVPEKKK